MVNRKGRQTAAGQAASGKGGQLFFWSRRDIRSWSAIFPAARERSREGAYLVFIEVKYRRNLGSGSPLEAVNPAKQEKIRRTALYYLYCRGYDEETPCRFDVVAVTGERFELIRDAF